MRRKRHSSATPDCPALPVHRCPDGDACTCEPIGAYLRVSALMGRGDDLISPELQLIEQSRDAARRRQRIVEVFFDIGSGRTFTRRKVGEVIDAIKAGRFTTIKLWKWSRWGRNSQESLTWLAKVREAGGKVQSATEDFDQDTAIGRFGLRNILSVDELLSDQISETWRMTHNWRRSEGMPHTATERFGYDVVDKKYVVYEPEAAILKDAYERFVVGTSLHTLAMEWNARGLRTGRAGSRWNAKSLGRMMDSGFAAGWLRWRSDPADPKSPLDVERRGTHPAIITEETWQAYRARRESLARVSPRLARASYELSGLLYCAAEGCGRRLYAANNGGERKVYFWRCTAPKDLHGDGKNVSLTNEKALAYVRAWVVGQAERFGTEPLEVQVARLQAQMAATADAGQADAELSRIARRMEILLDDRLDGTIDKATFTRRKARLEAEAIAARAVRDEAKAREAAAGDSAGRAFTTLAELWDRCTVEERAAMLKAVIERIEVAPLPAGRDPYYPVEDRVRIVPLWQSPLPSA